MTQPEIVPTQPEIVPELLAELGAARAATDVLATAVRRFPGRVAFASSLGLEDQVITPMIAEAGLDIPIFTLDTGRLFPETYDLIDRTSEALRLCHPRRTSPTRPRSRRWSPRRREPLPRQHRAAQAVLRGAQGAAAARARRLELDAWVCGLRSGQGATRQAVEPAEWDAGAGIVKINPLAAWDEAGVWDYVRAHDVPYNPLHDQGFPSIGCAPCTRAVAEGEDARVGALVVGERRAPRVRAAPAPGGASAAATAAAADPGAEPPHEPARDPRSQERPHPARGLPLAGQRLHAVVDRQGQHRAAAPGAQGVLRPRADPAGAHRHRLQDARDDRVPRPAGARVAAQPRRRARTARRSRRRRPSPTATATASQCCRNLKTMALKHTLDGEWPRLRMDHTLGKLVEDQDRSPYTGVIVGVRADEEGSRSKERYFSPRDVENDWDVDDQPPELWRYFKTDFEPGTHVRVHPLLDWTELNVWEYIERESIPVTSLYFDDGTGTRCRSLGCWPCTTPVESTATNVGRDHRGAAHRQVQQHRRAQRPRPGQGRRRRPRDAAPRGVHVSTPAEHDHRRARTPAARSSCPPTWSAWTSSPSATSTTARAPSSAGSWPTPGRCPRASSTRSRRCARSTRGRSSTPSCSTRSRTSRRRASPSTRRAASSTPSSATTSSTTPPATWSSSRT